MILNLVNFLKENKLPLIVLMHASEENYPLIDFAANLLKQKLINPTLHKFMADRYFDYEQIKQILSNTSLFNNSNYIEINHKTKPTVEQQQQIIKLSQNLDTNSLLIITTDKLAKKDLASTWVQEINNCGIILGLSQMDAKSMITYSMQQAKLSLSNEALALLLELNQANMAQLFQELQKIILLYPAATHLQVADIHKNDNSQYNIYQLSKSYLTGDLSTSLKILTSLFTSTEDAILISWIIGEDLRKLIKLKGKQKQQVTMANALPELKAWSDNNESLQLAANRLSYNQLLQLLQQLSHLDLMIKGVIKGNVMQLLSQIIVEFAS